MLVVAVAVSDASGSILMQRRRQQVVHGGLWEFPGGKVEAGETPAQAACREIAEELDIALDPGSLTLVGRASDCGAGAAAPLTIVLYACANWTGVPVCRDAEELAWVDPRAIPALAMPPLDYPLAQALLGTI